MGAKAISRPQTQRDLPRMSAQVKGSLFDSVRWWRTLEKGLNFPDTEEVTGSNPVRPTIFEHLSRLGEPKGEPDASGMGVLPTVVAAFVVLAPAVIMSLR